MAEENNLDGVEKMSSISQYIDPAKIEMDIYEPIKTPRLTNIGNLPGGERVSNQTYKVKDSTVGSTPNYPVKSGTQSFNYGEDRVANLVNKAVSRIDSLEDKNQYAKLYAYDAGPSGAHKARYKAYGQETFDKVGFHPYIDNETWFNQNITQYDDFKRMMQHSAWPLLNMGFVSPLKSYANFFSGDFGQDVTEARNYEEAIQLGYSTKGGVGGFTTNLIQSAAYSAGILLEGALEGAAVGAAIGAAEGGLPAIPGAAIGGATGFVKNLFRLPSAFAKMTMAVGKMATNLKSASNISQARNMFVNASKSMGNFFNPLDNTKAAAMQYVFKNPDDLSNLARTARTFGAFWNDVKNLNLALSEGRLEGGMAEDDTYNQLYNDHYTLYGEPPSDELQQQFRETAKAAGFTNTMWNSGLVFYSNKLVFPAVTQAKFLKGMPKFGFGTVIGETGGYQFVFTPAKDITKSVITAEKISLRNAMRGLTQPKIWGRVGLNYFKRNLIEGFQEVGQEAIAAATKDYYVNTYYNPAAKNYQYGLATAIDGINKQFGADGFKTFMSGFAMGSILQLPANVGRYASIGYNKYLKNRENYEENETNLQKDIETVEQSLNTIYKNSKYFFDPRLNNYVNQALVGKVIDNPDDHTTAEIKDSEFAAFQSAVYTALRTGTYNMFLDNFGQYKQASPQELEDAWNLEQGQGEKALLSIDKAIESANVMAQRYTVARNKMKFTKDLTKYKEGTEDYRKAALFNEAYHASIQNLLFTQSSFDDNLGRLSNMYGELGKLSALQDSRFSDVTVLTDPLKLSREIAMLQTEIETAETYTDTAAVEQVKEKKAMLESLTMFQETQDNLLREYINNQFIKQRRAELLAEDPSLTEESVEIKVIDELIEEYDTAKTNPFLEYKEAFVNLLNTLAATPEKQLLLEKELIEAGTLDRVYDTLLDTHIIREQNNKLSKYVNMLNDPEGFYEHVERNFKWMKDLYNNKEQYYKDVVTSEITNIQRNEILNQLASEGIYVDLEQFADWVEDPNKLPEYFIDEPRKMIINSDSILYPEYIQLFIDATNLQEQMSSVKPTSKEVLDNRIIELEKEKDSLIDEARERYNVALKKEIGFTEDELAQKAAELQAQTTIKQEELEKLQAEREYLSKALKLLDSKEIAEVQSVYLTAVENGYLTEDLFTESANIIAQDPEKIKEITDISNTYDNTIEQEARVSVAFIPVILKPLLQDRSDEVEALITVPTSELPDPKTTVAYAVFQEEVEAINQKYENLINDLRNDFRDKVENVDSAVEASVTTSYDDLPQDLKKILDPLFIEHLQFIEESPNLADYDPEKFKRIRKRWLESQGQVIAEYNKTKKLEAEELAKSLLEPPVLKFAPAEITSKTPGNVLTSLYDALSSYLEKGEYKDTKNKTLQLTPQNIKDIQDDLAALERYIDARTKAYEPKSVAESVINTISKTVIDRGDELVDVFDEDGIKIGRTFRDRSETDPMPLRATKVAEQVELDLLGKDPFLFNKLKDGTIQKDFQIALTNEDIQDSERLNFFMTAFEKKNYPSFRSKRKMKLLKESLESNFTEENLIKTVQRLAYDESTIAGNNIDRMIRDFLTLSATGTGFMEVTWDPDTMTKEAFDSLFHPAYGIISKFRQGVVDNQYRILSENVKVFDKNLRGDGVTGEMDLLVVDKDGNVMIVDIKSGKEKNWKAFGSGKESDKETYFRAQQSIYRNLFYNMSGIMPTKIGLMPLETKTDLDGKVLSVKVASIVPEGMDTVELEYLPEVEAFGITPIAPSEATITPTEGKKAPSGIEPTLTIPSSDLSKNTLEDNLDKPVLYNGNLGKLVVSSDGVYGFEVIDNSEVTSLSILLDSLENDLVVAQGEFGNDAEVERITRLINETKSKLENKQNLSKIIDLTYEMLPVKNAKLTLAQVGLSPVTEVKSISQVSQIKSETIDAKFDNANENTATINGVKYRVNRNAQDNIVSLTYYTNDAAIAEIEVKTKELSNRIAALREKSRGAKDSEKSILLAEISKAQVELNDLNNKRSKLQETNAERTLRGGNANNYIFALNRLPNSFQKLAKNKTSQDEKADLKEIENLSVSSSAANYITQILETDYPDALDTLITDGVFKINAGDLSKISLWAKQSIDKLEEYGFSVLNNNEIVSDVTNQINALYELLNDLESIRLTKNGKISKKQPEARKIFGKEAEQKLPTRPSVSEDERTRLRQAETVSRQVTDEEFKQLVADARQVTPISLVEETEVTGKTAEIIDQINNATDIQTLEDINDKAIIDEAKNSGTVDLNSVFSAYNQRKIELSTITSINSIAQDEYLLSKKDIGDTFSGSIFRVTSLESDRAYITDIITKKGDWYTAEEVADNFEKTTEEALDMDKPDMPITEEDVQTSQESIKELEDFANDPEAIDAAKTEANSKSEEDIFKSLKENSKLCPNGL